MKIELNTDLEIDGFLYCLEEKRKKVYRPCPVCNNTREVQTDTNPRYSVNCPRCSNKQVKGDENMFIEILHYSCKSERIVSFSYCDEKSYYGRTSDLEWFINREIRLSNLKGGYNGNTQYYKTEKEAKEICKKLNAEQKEQEKDFLI